MKVLTKTEVRYMVSKGIKNSILSKNSYIPKEIEVQDTVYGFYVDEDDGFVQVLAVYGGSPSGTAIDKEDWKINI